MEKKITKGGNLSVPILWFLAVLFCRKLCLDQAWHVLRVVISCTHACSCEGMEYNCMHAFSLWCCRCSHLWATISTLALGSSPLHFANSLLVSGKLSQYNLGRRKRFCLFFFPSPHFIFSSGWGKHLACCQKATREKSSKNDKRSVNDKAYIYCGHYRMCSIAIQTVRPCGWSEMKGWYDSREGIKDKSKWHLSL